MIALHVLQILVYGIGRTRIPFTVGKPLIGRQHSHTANITVQIPGNPDADVGIEPQRLVLGQDTYRIHAGIDTVGKGKINDTVFPSESHGRFCYFGCEDTQPTALPTCQQHGYHFFLDHIVTSVRILILSGSRLYTPCPLLDTTGTMTIETYSTSNLLYYITRFNKMEYLIVEKNLFSASKYINFLYISEIFAEIFVYFC